MQITLTAHPQYLRALVRRRQGAEEGRAAALSIVEGLRQHGLKRLLVVSEENDPVFRVEQYGLADWLRQISSLGLEKAALVSDSREVFASHQYIELLASQRGVVVKAFREEKQALSWLLDKPAG